MADIDQFESHKIYDNWLFVFMLHEIESGCENETFENEKAVLI